MYLSPGTVLADRYQLARHIATGGMGEVWEALDTRLHRRVAVKVLKPEISADPDFLDRFRVEARTAARLNHPGIASVYDYGENPTLVDTGQDAPHQGAAAAAPAYPGTAYLVMELVQGEALSAVLAREGRVELGLSLDMLEQTAQALQVAHTQGVVHRDVKPGNILITPEGRVKITDFGIAKAMDAAPMTRTGLVMGTASYLSPEQALGQEASPASDVYSLAVVGYEAVSGERLFAADHALAVAMMHIRDTPRPLPVDLPVAVRRLLFTALVKDPSQRYRDGAEFAYALAAVRAGRALPMPLGWVGGDETNGTEVATGRTAALPRRIDARRSTPSVSLGRGPRTDAWLWLAGILATGLLALALYVLLTPPDRPGPTSITPEPASTGGPPAAGVSSANSSTVLRSTTLPPTTLAPTTLPPTTLPPTTPAPASAPSATSGAGRSSATMPATTPVATGNIATAQGRP